MPTIKNKIHLLSFAIIIITNARIMAAIQPLTQASKYITLEQLFQEEELEQRRIRLSEELIDTIKGMDYPSTFLLCGYKDVKYKNIRVRSLQALEQKLVADLRILLDQGADVNYCTNTWTALHYAAQYGLSSCVDFLIQNGAKIDAKTKQNQTPLHLAASSNGYKEDNYLECIRSLITAGATIDIVDNCGMTAYQYAVSYCRPKMIVFLLEMGASPSLKIDELNKIKVHDKKILDAIENGVKKNIARSNWARVAFLMAFMRANGNSTIKNSGLALVGEVGKFASLGTTEERYERSLHGH